MIVLVLNETDIDDSHASTDLLVRLVHSIFESRAKLRITASI